MILDKMVILTNFPPPTEGIRYQQDNTAAVIDQKELGNGTIYIAESRLSWRGSEAGAGFSLEYKAISLHAVSRDLSAFPSECLYLMLDGKILDDENMSAPNGNTSDDESDDENPITEIRFIPTDKGVLNAMYQSMTECQLLHPDEQSTDSEAEEEEADYYNNEEGIEHLTSDGLSNLHRLDNILEVGQGDGEIPGNENSTGPPMDQGQFDDADMEQ